MTYTKHKKSSIPKALFILLCCAALIYTAINYSPLLKVKTDTIANNIVQSQQKLISTEYNLLNKIYDYQQQNGILNRQVWITKHWLIWGGGGGLLLPIFIFFLVYLICFRRLIFLPCSQRYSGSSLTRSLTKNRDQGRTRLPILNHKKNEKINLIKRKVLKVHWRSNFLNLEKSLINIVLFGLCSFALHLVVSSFFTVSAGLQQAGVISFLLISYTILFFNLVLKYCNLRQAAQILDEKLGLKQAVITAIEYNYNRNSRLFSYLVDNTSSILQSRKIADLFPYRIPKLKKSAFFSQL